MSNTSLEDNVYLDITIEFAGVTKHEAEYEAEDTDAESGVGATSRADQLGPVLTPVRFSTVLLY